MVAPATRTPSAATATRWPHLLDPVAEDAAARRVTWSDADALGPQPPPAWLVTADAEAEDVGLLKAGKEAEVHVQRWTALDRIDPSGGDGPSTCLVAVKRYGDHDAHRAAYRAGREALGRFTIGAAGGWGVLEFHLLAHLWSAGVSVPYPVLLHRGALVMELVGDRARGVAAPRLAAHRPASAAEAEDLWAQARALVRGFAAAEVAHGDLSPYNVLVHDGRLVAIDVPQAVDLLAHPGALAILERDCRNLAGWFLRHRVPGAGGDVLLADALAAGPW